MLSFVRVGAPLSVRHNRRYEAAEVREMVDYELLGRQQIVSRTRGRE